MNPFCAISRVALLITALFAAGSSQAQSLEISLEPSDHNGYNISCNGAQDGSIDLTITGGTPPYTIGWSNKITTEDISGLAAGYYKVGVTDVNGQKAEEEITLTEPLDMKASLNKSIYPSGHNISCFECSNGTISPSITNGVAPFTYLWTDGPTTANRWNLGPGEYKVLITDANGCTQNPVTQLTQPERSDWTMNGNAGTDPATNYFGTSDDKDAVFRSNAVERLRLKSNGDIKFSGLTGAGNDLLYVDGSGVIKRGPGGGSPAMSVIPWYLGGNNNVSTSLNRIGPMNNVAFILMTDATERMRITNTGLVGIGTNAPEVKLHVAHTDERGGLDLDNVRTDDNAHSEIRFMKNGTGHWALGCDMEADGGQDFFLWDQEASASRMVVDSDGRVGIGDVDFGGSDLYKLYVEGGIVSRDVKVTVDAFPDHVFAPDYPLLSLDRFREHLQQQHHLPGIPSAAEVEAAKGVEVGDLQVRMLKALEEQALYILQLEERIKALEARPAAEPTK